MMQATGMNGGNSGNRRTALALAAVALAFFFAIMLKYWLAQ
jgi:hypothetical protein